MDATNAERQARHRAKVRKEVEALRNASTDTAKLIARIRELEAELAREKQRAASSPKPARRQIDPDSELAKLRKSNRELRAQVEKIKWDARMPSATYSVVVKCIHPDTASQFTEEQRRDACGLLTEWKKKQDGRR
jgi:hypothetical protein